MENTQEVDVFVDSLREQIIKNTLKQAETAHHQYEEEELQGLRDNNWARWYASFIKNNTEQNLFENISTETIEQALEHATTAQVFHKDYTWEAFTANYFVNYLPLA